MFRSFRKLLSLAFNKYSEIHSSESSGTFSPFFVSLKPGTLYAFKGLELSILLLCTLGTIRKQ